MNKEREVRLRIEGHMSFLMGYVLAVFDMLKYERIKKGQAEAFIESAIYKTKNALIAAMLNLVTEDENKE